MTEDEVLQIQAVRAQVTSLAMQLDAILMRATKPEPPAPFEAPEQPPACRHPASKLTDVAVMGKPNAAFCEACGETIERGAA